MKFIIYCSLNIESKKDLTVDNAKLLVGGYLFLVVVFRMI